MSDVADGPLEFTCPRCRLDVTEDLYGPCGSCRATLHTLVTAEARAVDAAAYEPKMNVTPNAVALKD
jgi:cytidine deaminase